LRSGQSPALASFGIELRQGDYLDRAPLSRALAGVEKLMLPATHAFTERNTAHANVMDVAVETGVRHLVFMRSAAKGIRNSG
jgi:NAD(P)H dehydrogenase (quinone)